MTGTLRRSAALACIIAPWLMMIAYLFGIIVKTILSVVGLVFILLLSLVV